MSNQPDLFYDSARPADGEVYLGNATSVSVKTKGDINLHFDNGEGKTNFITLKNVLGVPNLSRNLISVFACVKNGFSVLFDHNTKLCKIFDDRRTWGVAKLKKGLWVVECDTPTTNPWALNVGR